MRKVVSFLSVLALALLAFAADTHVDAGRPRTAMIGYNNSYRVDGVGQPTTAQLAAWEAARFGYVIEGFMNPGAGPTWPGYVNHSYVYADQMYDVRASGTEHSFTYEDAMNHIKVDYEAGGGKGWVGMDQFDAFEKTSIGGSYLNAAKGVFILTGAVEGGAYTDKTVAAYDSTTGDVAITDKLLLGYMEKFAEATFVLTVGASGGATTGWTYWNGSSWATLTVTNGTLASSGTMTFTPPTDWAIRVVNGSKSKYWIMATMTGGGTTPVATSIKGDNWLTGANAWNARGWDATDPNIVNGYNPTPPAGASAHFRYQARALSGYWADNATMGNPAKIVSGKRIWSQYLVDAVEASVATYGYTGVMFDDAIRAPTTVPPDTVALTQSDWSDAGGLEVSYAYSQTQGFIQEAADLHAEYSPFQVGVNSDAINTLRIGEFGLVEPFNYAQSISTNTRFKVSAYENDPDRQYLSTSFDGFLTANNSNQTKGLLMCQDNLSALQDNTLANHVWERGDRGPMVCLATYHIGSNSNTGFIYNSFSFLYADTDDYFYLNVLGTQPTLTTGITAGAGNAEIRDTVTGFSTFSATNTGAMAWGNTADGCSVLPQVAVGDTPDTREYFCVTKDSSALLTANATAKFNHSIGEKVYEVRASRQSLDGNAIPSYTLVYKWGDWFPAMGVDVGTPDTLGYNSGVRSRANWADTGDYLGTTAYWKLGSEVTSLGTGGGRCVPEYKCASVARRDFTKAIVLLREFYNGGDTDPAELDAPSVAMALGGTYYPLHADGTLGAGITTIQLRAGEGAILMKSVVPPAIGRTKISGAPLIGGAVVIR